MPDTVTVSAADVQVVSEVLNLATRAFGSALVRVPGFGEALEACGRMTSAASLAQLPEDPLSGNKPMAIVYSELLRSYLEADFQRPEAFRLVEIQAAVAAQMALARLHG
ncbi:MAG: hypothetical protein WA766_21545 [Candidatus Acidiferrales bacterium]